MNESYYLFNTIYTLIDALQDFDKKSSSASTVDANNSLTTNGSPAGSAADAGTAADPDAFFM